MKKRYWAIAATAMAISIGLFFWYNRKADYVSLPEPAPIVQKVETSQEANSSQLLDTLVQESTKEPDSETAETLESAINNTIKIASFNIQTFGRSKIQNEETMYVLTNTVRNFDIVAIQEIRDNSETTLAYFINKINELPGDKYDCISSTRLGRTISKEKYAFIYNTKTVKYGGVSYVYNDANDVFEREPFVAGFISGRFDYILVNIHIKPDDAEKEISSLVYVTNDALLRFPDDKDVIVLGDFNADGSYFSETIATGFRDSRYRWIVTDDMDTTVALSSNTYDRIVFQPQFTNEDYAGKCGVFLFDAIYNLTNQSAVKVSDHYPVWGIFYTNKDSD